MISLTIVAEQLVGKSRVTYFIQTYKRLTHQIIKYDNAHVFRPRLKFKLSDVNLSVNL